MDMQHGHAACSCSIKHSMDKQHEHAAFNTAYIEKHHGYTAWRHGDGAIEMEHGNEEWTCSIGMQIGHAKRTCNMSNCIDMQH
jgi:hypothetical protein